jgi:hypothetical protein
MIDRPYDLSVPKEEITIANRWWSNLSLNEMKAFRDKYTGTFEWNGRQVPIWDVSLLSTQRRTIHQIWEEEGKPLVVVDYPPELPSGKLPRQPTVEDQQVFQMLKELAE